MDEASSRFVDRLVLEKLLNEKLTKVQHRTNVGALTSQPELVRLDEIGPVVFSRDQRSNAFLLRSPVRQHHVSNEWVRVATHEVEGARGALVLVHGLFEDNRALYRFLIDELNRLHYSVYSTTLPYHYERVPSDSRFSGEFFLSADLVRTIHAFESAVAELESCQIWLREQQTCPLFTVGFSMGATVALAHAARQKRTNGIVAINPAAGISSAIWTSPLCEPIQRDLCACGLNELTVSPYLLPLCPLHEGLDLRISARILMIRALYDQVTQQSQYDALAQLLPRANVLKYKAGHLNTLRVPRLAADIVNFCESLVNARIGDATHIAPS
jgi:dienelactone hydrolase